MPKPATQPRVTKSISMQLSLSEKIEEMRYETRESFSGFMQSAAILYIEMLEKELREGKTK